MLFIINFVGGETLKKDRQYNGQNKKTNNDLKHYTEN